MKQPARRKGANTAEQDENFSFGSNETYAKAADYARERTAFDVLAVAFEPKRGYEGRDRWALTVQPAGRDPEILTLGSNEKRDQELRGAQEHLKRGGLIKKKRLRLSRGAYYLENA